MRIGELAHRAGTTTDAIRYYEREGLIPEPRRTSAGYRDYGPEAIGDLVFIRKAQTLGLRLWEIREVMEISAGGTPPCTHVRSTIEAHLTDVDRRLRELRELRTALTDTLRRLEEPPGEAMGCRCAAIESIGAGARRA